MTHLVDTSVWQKITSYPQVESALLEIEEAGAVFSTCPPVVAEYCFSARDIFELNTLQGFVMDFYQLDEKPLTHAVAQIQKSLWKHGLARAAGAIDTEIAAYALDADHEVVTCDLDYVHISRALKLSRSRLKLRVSYISETGEITTL